MKIDKKYRALFISAVLLISSLSIISFQNNVKADSGIKTDLYFHEDDVLKDDAQYISIISAYSMLLQQDEELNRKYQILNKHIENITEESGDMNLTAITNIINICLNNPKLISKLLTGILGAEMNESIFKYINLNPPTKENMSKYPALNIENIIDTLTNIEDDYMQLFEMLKSLAPLTSVYPYKGEETVNIDGQITFSLYFDRSLTYILNNDTIKASLYILNPEEYTSLKEDKFNKTKKITIDRLELSNAIKNPALYELKFDIKDVNLKTGDLIITVIERKEGEKYFLKDIRDEYSDFNLSDFSETIKSWGEDLQRIPIDSISDIGILLVNISENITAYSDLLNESELIDLLYNILNKVISSTLVYDSISYPSHISLPCKITEDRSENVKIYYLQKDDDAKTVLESNKPEGDEPEIIDFSKQSNTTWIATEKTDMSKILKKTTMGLYLEYRDLFRLVNLIRGKITINANLYANDKIIATAERELDRTTLFDLLNSINPLEENLEPVMFNFSINEEKEIPYDTLFKLDIFIDNNTEFGLGLYRNVKLLYESESSPSFVVLDFEDTDNIEMKVTGPSEVAAGESAHYTFNITSKYNDNITINDIKTPIGKWTVEYPDNVEVKKDANTLVDVYINSTATNTSAYDKDKISVSFEVSGKTGRVIRDVNVIVSEDAAVYDIDFIKANDKEIKRGEDGVYHIIFENNNTGFLPDYYATSDINAISEHGFPVKVYYNNSDLLDTLPGEEVEFRVKVWIPKDTDVKKDILTIIVNSTYGEKTFELNLTTTIPEPTILESIYNFFDSVAESIGLDSILGDYAGYFILFILIFIIIIFLIIIIYIMKRKYIEIVCLDRIQEITPEGKAEYGIAIHNPSNQKMTFEAYVEIQTETPGWEVSLNTNTLVIEPKSSQVIVLNVKPTDLVKPNDWIEAKVIVQALEKQKTDSISTVTSITDEKPELKITGVFHWPQQFKKGEKITTSFKVENKGRVAAEKVIIKLYVNGEEKNKVEDITIPSGGYADIEIPWIAEKGKNDIDIIIE